MKVLFVASELTPLAKVGGLGDVIGSLPKELADLAADVKIVLPFDEVIDRKVWKPRLRIKNYELGIKGEKIDIYSARLPRSSVEVFLVYNKKYLSTGPIYFEKTAFAGSKKEVDRFIFFSQAVFRLLAQTKTDDGGSRGKSLRSPLKSAESAFSPLESAIGWQPDVVHCNDWHTGELVKEISNRKLVISRKSKKDQLLSLRDISRVPTGHPPKGDRETITNYQLPKTVFTIHNLANQGATKRENLMAEGIKNADIITTVSPTYAKEILTKKYGAGLDKLLRTREKAIVGILNGVDYGFWTKKHARLDNIPTFGLVSRLTYQKGIDLVAPLVGEFVKKYNAQFWFLGQGEPQNEAALENLARKHPKNVFTTIGFNEKLAHYIYRECDFFLMPSRFEPSGLGQMISMHYGTVPIVRATGGLKDTVKHLKTGFVFKNESAADFRKAMELAVKYFYDKKKFNAIRKNCLNQDFSWNKSARKYKRLYAGFGNPRDSRNPGPAGHSPKGDK